MNAWAGERWRAALLLALAGLAGLLFGHFFVFLSITLAFYLYLHLRQLARLEEWLRRKRRFEPPEAAGIWGEVFQDLYALQKRHRKRKRRLSNALKRFRRSTAAMPYGTVVVNADGSIEWLNDAAERMLGLKSPGDHGQPVGNLIRHPAFTEYLGRGEFEDSIEIPWPKNPTKTLSIRVTPYGKGQQLVLARDNTRVRRLETMRQDFVANVSHELRTPLTVVRGYVETLRDDDSECTRQIDPFMAKVEGQVIRMQQLVDDLLTLSRLEAQSNKDTMLPAVNIVGMVTAIAEEARNLAAERGHEIELEVSSNRALQAEPGQLRSAFSNLVFNAVQYTPDNGLIRIVWENHGDGARFSVIDNGEGIPARDLPRLTERFYRVDKARSRESGGTGLGLAIVKHVLSRHDAELLIESEAGEGSRFICEFPAERVAAEDNAA